MGRAERRRQSKLDETTIAGGLNLSLRDARQLAALTRVLHEEVGEAIAKKSITGLMEFIYVHHTKTLKSIAHIQLACQRGCSHCCHGWVSATAPEILYAVKSISSDRLTAVREKVWTANIHTEGKSPEARERLTWPCPLLEDHACSVYKTRPIMCRSAVSTDAQICLRSCLEFSGENIPTPKAYYALSDGYTVALACALKKAGLPHRAMEYNAGLKEALGIPDAEALWLSGQPVFARIIQDNDLLNEPWVKMLYAEAFS